MKKTTVLVAILFVSCAQTYEPKPAPIPRDTDWCLEAELNLELMECKDRAGDPMWVNKLGERFEKTCKTAQQEGRIFINPKCISESDSCEKAKICPADGM